MNDTAIIPTVRYLLDSEVLLSCDVAEVISKKARAFSIHSSYPWSLTTVERSWGYTSIYAISTEGTEFSGTIKELHKLIGGFPTWWHVRLDHIIQQSFERPLDYDFLLQCCKGVLPKCEIANLYVEDLWRMWGVSRRELQPKSPALHKANIHWIACRSVC